MDNGINQRQNSEKGLEMLGAANVLYSEAKSLNNISFILCVVFQLLINYINKFEINNDIISFTRFIIILGTLIYMWYSEIAIKDKCKTAADIQQLFDKYIFDINSINNDCSYNNCRAVIVTKYLKYNTKSYHKKYNINDWYNIDYSKIPLKKAIYKCQECSIRWDKTLRVKYMYLILSILILNFLIVFGIGITVNETLSSTLNRFILMFPMFKWCGDNILKLKQDLKLLDKLLNNFSENEIEELQSQIYKHRKLCILVPDIFYRLTKNKIECNENSIAVHVSKENV